MYAVKIYQKTPNYMQFTCYKQFRCQESSQVPSHRPAHQIIDKYHGHAHVWVHRADIRGPRRQPEPRALCATPNHGQHPRIFDFRRKPFKKPLTLKHPSTNNQRIKKRGWGEGQVRRTLLCCACCGGHAKKCLSNLSVFATQGDMKWEKREWRYLPMKIAKAVVTTTFRDRFSAAGRQKLLQSIDGGSCPWEARPRPR